MALDLDPVFDQAGRAFNVDPGILKGVAQTESGNLPDPDNAVSSAGAIGRMQIMPETARGLGVNPRDPVQAIWGAANQIAQNMQQFGNVPDALRAYNAGPDTSRWNNPETAAYVQKVASNYAPVGDQSEGGAPVSGSATPQLDAALAAAQAGKFATPPQQQAPSGDAYSTLFGSTDPGSSKPAAVAPSATTAGTDAYSQMFGSTDPAAPKPTTPTAPPGGILSDVNQAVNAAGARIDSAAIWGLDHIPGVSGVLNGTAIDPAKLSAADKAQLASYQNSTASQVGTAVGTGLLGGLAAEAGGGLVGAAGGAAANAIGGVGGRVVQAGTNLLTGGGGLTGAAKLAAAATSGAAKGVLAGAATATGNVASNALIGGVLGPVIPAIAAPALKYAGQTGNAVLNRLAPVAANDETPAVQNALAARFPVPAASVASSGDAIPQGLPPQSGAASPSSQAAATEQAPTTAQAASAPADQPPSQVAPDKPIPPVNLGIVPNPAKAETLADQVIQAHAQGAPMVLVKSQIPGVQLTLAQASQNPGIARLESMMRDQNPNAFAALESSNQTNRNGYLQGITLTPDDVDQMQAALSASEAANRDAAFANAQPVDAVPVVNQIDSAISNARANGPVVKALQAQRSNIVSALDNVETDENGNITAATADPANLWNARKAIGYSLSTAADDSDSARAASAQLAPLMDTLASSINEGAPGFDKYLADYRAQSQPIAAAQWLQNRGMTDTSGNVQVGPLFRAIGAVNKARLNNDVTSGPGQVSDDQLSRMNLLYNDLLLKSGAQNLGKTAGSNTAQNLFTQAKTAALMQGKSAGLANLAAMAGGVEATGSGLGALAGYASRGAQQLYMNRLAATQDAANKALLNRLISP